MVCDRGDGFPLYPDALTRAFKRPARRAGMHPATRQHDVRHAVATELGRRGVHPAIVSAVLGHASPAFMIAVYQHAWQEGPSEAAQALEAALRPFVRSGELPALGEEARGARLLAAADALRRTTGARTAAASYLVWAQSCRSPRRHRRHRSSTPRARKPER